MENLKNQRFDLTDTITALCDLKNEVTHSECKLPALNVKIQSYIRHKEGHGGLFDDKDTFFDSVEVAIMQLCVSLFLNSEAGSFDREKLEKFSEKLQVFFGDLSIPLLTVTLKHRKEWSKIVQDLPDLEEFSFDKDFKTNKIFITRAIEMKSLLDL